MSLVNKIYYFLCFQNLEQAFNNTLEEKNFDGYLSKIVEVVHLAEVLTKLTVQVY